MLAKPRSRFSLCLSSSQASQGNTIDLDLRGAALITNTLSNNLHTHTHSNTTCGYMSQQFNVHCFQSAVWLFKYNSQPAEGQSCVYLRVRWNMTNNPFTPALNMPLMSRSFSRSISGQSHLHGSLEQLEWRMLS